MVTAAARIGSGIYAKPILRMARVEQATKALRSRVQAQARRGRDGRRRKPVGTCAIRPNGLSWMD